MLQTKDMKIAGRERSNNNASQHEGQLRMAGALQRDFLPRWLPDSDRLSWSALFMPADWVSGDIYDVARVDEEHIGFYMADAVGHSMPAALLTIFIKQAIQMRETVGNEYKIFSPIEVISNLNQRMVELNLSGCQFATCCYCLLNTETLKMTYCRAGHPYPLLVKYDGSIEQMQNRGSLLGVFENAQFEQDSVQLWPGEKIIIYSDGCDPFVEKKIDSENCEVALSEEFKSVTRGSAKDVTNNFKKLVRRNLNETEEVDDVTMLTLEVLSQE
ncbi:MAG: SpoIIE family protein phosphatase [Anaerohalosphaeraceae bacterium]|nr:SpoIIE family protein phosphatase [Anaerohalosphaeraceae bacterium]